MILDDGLSVGLDCNIALLHDYAIKHFYDCSLCLDASQPKRRSPVVRRIKPAPTFL